MGNPSNRAYQDPAWIDCGVIKLEKIEIKSQTGVSNPVIYQIKIDDRIIIDRSKNWNDSQNWSSGADENFNPTHLGVSASTVAMRTNALDNQVAAKYPGRTTCNLGGISATTVELLDESTMFLTSIVTPLLKSMGPGS